MFCRKDGKKEKIIGDSPASCGFIWDTGRKGWYRPFGKDDMFTAYGKKPEWDRYAPGRYENYIGATA